MSASIGLCQRLCLLLLLFSAPAIAAERVAGETYLGRNQYIEYVAGNLPFILSVPHGGREKPEEIPNRASGTFAYDRGTQEIAREIITEFHAKTGGWPHVVICRLQRTKLDCNREVVEAAAGNPHAEQAWREYQGFLDEAHQTVIAQHGRGLFIDLHGHGHKEQRLEFGYLHSAEELQASDAELDDPRWAAASSLRGIAALNRRPYSQLLRGSLSFGTLMAEHGFPSTPSAAIPKPTTPFFRGGYNTGRHARDAVPLAGFQIETNFTGVRDKPANHQRFAKALYASLVVYLEANVGVALVPAKVKTAPVPAPVPVAPSEEVMPISLQSMPIAVSSCRQMAPSDCRRRLLFRCR